tara:strand:- start:1944 stop:3140 length:1197 start_codon:yes stop_codon:yes gene_type:complete
MQENLKENQVIEISVFDLFITLYKGKWLIILFVLMGLLAGFIYTQYFRTIGYNIEAKVYPVSEVSLVDLKLLHRDIDNLRQSTVHRVHSKSDLAIESFDFDSRIVFSLFHQTIYRTTEITDIILKEKLIYNEDLNEDQNRAQIRDFIKSIGIQVRPIVATYQETVSNLELRLWVYGVDPIKAKRNLDAVLTACLISVDRHIKNNLVLIINDYKKLIDDRLMTLKRDNEIIKKIASRALEDRVTVLDEQIQIAKDVGISKPIELSSTFSLLNSNETEVVPQDNESRPEYYRGSIALEAEKRLLLSRKELTPFLPQVRINQSEIETINIDFNFDNLIKKVNNISFSTDRPYLVTYEKEDMTTSPLGLSSRIILYLWMVSGLAAAVVIISIRMFYKINQKK